MTREQLEDYLTRLLPDLRRKFKTDQDRELVQRTIIDLFRKHEQFPVTNDKEFIDLFTRFYKTWVFHRRSAVAVCIKNGNHLGEFMGDWQFTLRDEEGDPFTYTIDQHDLFNPWTTVHAQVLEYLELIENPLLKQVMRWYYVEGYTLKEIKVGLQCTQWAVEVMLKRGVKILKEWEAEGTESKPIGSL